MGGTHTWRIYALSERLTGAWLLGFEYLHVYACTISCVFQVLQDDLQRCVSAFESIDHRIIDQRAGVMKAENRSGSFYNQMTFLAYYNMTS